MDRNSKAILWSVFLCYVWWWVALSFLRIATIKQNRETGGYDNENPRKQQSELTGWGARALGAVNHQGEGFAFFAAGAILNLLVHGINSGSRAAAIFSVIHVVLRGVHLFFYLTNLATLRSLTFFGSVICVFGVYINALTAAQKM